MFRLCLEKYIIDKKFNGYYVWERVAPFKYKEVLSGVNSLVNFFIKDDVRDTVEHVLSKKQSKQIYNSNSEFKIHIKLTLDKVKKYGNDFSYGTYDDFIAEFTKQELDGGWDRDEMNPQSFIANKYTSKIHASLLMFNNIYMIMKTNADYLKVENFIKDNEYKPIPSGKLVDKWNKQN